MNFLENINLKFPHISEIILQELDDQSLTECRKVSRSMCNFIDNTKIPWMRMINKHMGDNEQLQKSWTKVLHKCNVEIIRQLALTVNLFQMYMCNGTTPLHFAVRSGQTNVFMDIFQRSEDKNPSDDSGVTPLHIAAEKGHLSWYKAIMKNLEDKNPKNKSGFTPLHRAAYRGYLPMCKLIMKHLEDKNPKNNAG